MSSKTLASMMAKRGFELYPMGGNCTAFVSLPDTPNRDMHGSGAVVITSMHNGPMAPESMQEAVCVGIFQGDDIGELETALLKFDSLRDALASII